MLIKPIPLKVVKKANKKYIYIIIITAKAFQKIFNGKRFLFLTNENLKYVKLVKKLILKKLSHFEKVFSKKQFTHIALLKPKYDVTLKLISNLLTFGLLKYKTLIKYIPFKKTG